MRIFLACLAWLFLVGSVEAKIPGGTGTTYYVGVAGCSDAGAGTSSAAPWCTITKVNASTFVAGDSILFQGGQTFAATPLQLFGTAASGHITTTSFSPVTVSTYGTGVATFTATSVDCIQIKDLGGLIVKNIKCVGNNAAGPKTAVVVFNDQGVLPRYDFLLFDNIEATGLNGFDIEGWNGSVSLNYGFSNITIRNSSIHDFTVAGAVCAFFFGLRNDTHTNVFIDQFRCYNHPGDGIDIWNITGAVIQRSIIHDGGSQSAATAGIQTQNINGCVIQYNEVYKISPAIGAQDADGIDIDQSSANCVGQYNYVHDNAGSGLAMFQGTGQPWYNNTFRYNITQDNGVGPSNVKTEIAIGASGGTAMSGAAVYGNSFSASLGAVDVNSCYLFNQTNITGFAANNICYVVGTGPRAIDAQTFNPTTFVFQGNDYFGSAKFKWNNVVYTTIAAWRAAVTSQETYRGTDTSLGSNPLITAPDTGGTCYLQNGSTSPIPNGPQPCPGEYLLQGGSPMLNAGQNMRNVFGVQPGARDYFGNIVPAPSNSNYDVGANQKTQ